MILKYPLSYDREIHFIRPFQVIKLEMFSRCVDDRCNSGIISVIDDTAATGPAEGAVALTLIREIGYEMLSSSAYVPFNR